MTMKAFSAPHRASRVKVGFAILAGVLTTLAAGQVAASPSSGPPAATQGGAP